MIPQKFPLPSSSHSLAGTHTRTHSCTHTHIQWKMGCCCSFCSRNLLYNSSGQARIWNRHVIKFPDNWISPGEMKWIQYSLKLCPACSFLFIGSGSLVLCDNTGLALAVICKQLRKGQRSLLIGSPGRPLPASSPFISVMSLSFHIYTDNSVK